MRSQYALFRHPIHSPLIKHPTHEHDGGRGCGKNRVGGSVNMLGVGGGVKVMRVGGRLKRRVGGRVKIFGGKVTGLGNG